MKKIYINQRSILSLILASALGLAACAETEQAERDINSPSAGLVRLGDQIRAQGDDNGAMEFYARATHRAPDDVTAHKKLAELLELHGMDTDAADQYRMLTQLEPDNVDHRRAYGRLLLKLGRTPEAKSQYEEALKIDPSDIKSQNGLGVATDLLGDHPTAEQIYKAALEQKPDDLITISNLGHSYVLAGAYDQAIKLLEPHAQNKTAPRALRENLAEAYGMTGMYVDAERVMRKDFTPAQIKKSMDRFRTAAQKSAPQPLYANLGSLSTSDLAQARLDGIKQQAGEKAASLSFDVVPEIDTVGGTPVFNVRASGFQNKADAEAFCKTLKQNGSFCKARGG